MATFIPALSSCTWDTDGERRLAHRISEKLGDEWICWCNIPIGPVNRHPDIILLHPSHGLLVLEVKDWKRETLVEANKKTFRLRSLSWEGTKTNPFVQARDFQHALINVLSKDKSLISGAGRYAGKLSFPAACGVVFTAIPRRHFQDMGLGDVITPNRVLCQDEMTESADAKAFEQRLIGMFDYSFGSRLSPAQIDRIRWHLFPEVRIQQLGFEMFKNEAEDMERVMDLKQEALARSLGEGHRIIHGVAGSGKTIILRYRAEYLAQASNKPILVLCYNRALAQRLTSIMDERGLSKKVRVRTFHQWCLELLRLGGTSSPINTGDNDAYFKELTARARLSTQGQKAAQQLYGAILVDEAHDFEAEWLQTISASVDPKVNSLLVLYDDAQSIYARDRKKFSFKSVGIQAAGRTTILKVNYRNSKEILESSASVARDILAPRESDEDGIPLVRPEVGGLNGPKPRFERFRSIEDEAVYVVQRLNEAHSRGIPWNQMAVLYRSIMHVRPIQNRLQRAGIPVMDGRTAKFTPAEDTVKFMTMHGCKGLEFHLVIIVGAASLKLEKADGPDDARLLYVAMTRARRELIVCHSGSTPLGPLTAI